MRFNRSTARFALAAAATVLGSALPLSARGDGGGEVEKPRYSLSPSYELGEKFRVTHTYRQTTYTGIHDSARNPKPPVNFSDYDASMSVDVLVTVDKVGPKGAAEVWTAQIDKLRVDIPDPLQSAEYRLRVRENKQKNLPFNAHPLEGATVKMDQSGAKTRLFKVLENGEDAGISQRYPEILPLMQELVDPDWSPVDSVSVGGEWEMNADHIFRLTRVLAKAPLKGTIRCHLASVIEGTANVDFTSTMKEIYATVEMRIELSGRIEFNVARRRQVGNKYTGEVQISAKGSALRGTGTVTGGSQFTPVTLNNSPR